MYNIPVYCTRQRARTCGKLFLTGLLSGCLLLLGACTSANGSSSNRERPSTPPTVGALLKREGQTEIQAFQQWIALMQSYNGDVSQYRQEYASDQQALISAKTDNAYQTVLQKLNTDVRSIQMLALKSEVSSLEQQLNQLARPWSQHHAFHDSYNDVTYQLGYEYGPDGAGGWLQDEISSAQTLADGLQAVEDASGFLTSIRAYQTNILDKTPWNQVHQTDLQILQHYHFMQRKAVVVSLSEQALRVYNHGRFVRAFLVTTGRPERPSLPGNWVVESKQSPTVFKSDEPPGSPYWYPDTPINYAMLYHSGGYFIHDSWWRNDYGPDTQFPHADSSGDSFSSNGSHGCVNIATDNAAWLYNYVDLNAPVLIY